MPSFLVRRRCQKGLIGVDDEHGEQPRRLRVAHGRGHSANCWRFGPRFRDFLHGLPGRYSVQRHWIADELHQWRISLRSSWYNSGASGTYGSVTAKVTLQVSIVPKDVGASLSGELGRYWLGTTDAFYGTAQLPDYTTWSVGLTFIYRTVALDLRYYDTNLSRANCNVLTGDHTATFGDASAVTPINPSGLISN